MPEVTKIILGIERHMDGPQILKQKEELSFLDLEIR